MQKSMFLHVLAGTHLPNYIVSRPTRPQHESPVLLKSQLL